MLRRKIKDNYDNYDTYYNYQIFFEDRPTDRQTDRQTNRQTDRQTSLGIDASSRSIKSSLWHTMQGALKVNPPTTITDLEQMFVFLPTRV